MFRYLRLDFFIQIQWYYEPNVEPDDSPEEVHRRPLPLFLYRWLWYSNQRQQRRRTPATLWWPHFCHNVLPFLSLLALLLLCLLMLPFALISLLVFGSLGLSKFFFYRVAVKLTAFGQRPLEAVQAIAFSGFAVVFYGLASFTLHLWAGFL